MDDFGELMVFGAIAWFFFDDDRLKKWPFMAGLFVLGAALYFIDRVLKRPRRDR